MKTCPSCGAEYPASVAFCFNDGMPLAAPERQSTQEPKAEQSSIPQLFEAPEPISVRQERSWSDDETDTVEIVPPAGISEQPDRQATPSESASDPSPDPFQVEATPLFDDDFFDSRDEASLDEEAFFQEPEVEIKPPSSGSLGLLIMGLVLLGAMAGAGAWAYTQTQNTKVTAGKTPAKSQEPLATKTPKANESPSQTKKTDEQDESVGKDEDVDEDGSEPTAKDEAEPEEDEAEEKDQDSPAKAQPKPKHTPAAKKSSKTQNAGTVIATTNERTTMRGTISSEDPEEPAAPVEEEAGEDEEATGEDVEEVRDIILRRPAEDPEEAESPWGPVDQ